MPDIDNNYKVRLIPIASLKFGGDPESIRQSQVAFDVTPAFSETGSVEYAAVTPVHLPGAIQMYKHTNSRQFEITAHLISRNVQDALKNMRYLQKLRGWRLPYFGGTNTLSASNQTSRDRIRSRQVGADSAPLSASERDQLVRSRVVSEGVQLRGAPPDVLYLYAYSTSKNDLRGTDTMVNINRVPVVLTNLSITYPDDVDYIPVYDVGANFENKPSAYAEPFPVKMDVSISLTETHSPREFERFDLLAYKQGKLANF